MTLVSMGVASQLPGAPALPIGNIVPPSSVEDTQIQIRNIEGLGPVKAEFQTAPFALSRGVFFQGSSTGQRNIVLTLGMNPLLSAGQSMSALRQLVYRYFMPEIQATFTFHTIELEDVHIDGYVESVEPNIFSQDPEMQISIICPRPDFIGDEAHEVTHNATTGTFQAEIEYTGTVSNGFELEVSNPDDYYTGPIEVANENGNFHEDLIVNTVKINPHQNFRLVTVPTRRRVQRRNLDEDPPNLYSILGRLTKNSTWPILFPGTNLVLVKVDESGPDWTMTYWNRYGGL